MSAHMDREGQLEIGVIESFLDDLLVFASQKWHERVTFRRLTNLSGLDAQTVHALRARQGAPTHMKKRVALQTVAALCSVFYCLPGELLRYRPAGGALPPLSPLVVRRAEVPPTDGRMVVHPITNELPTLLEGRTPAALEHATGIPWGIWRRAKSGTSQIDLRVLAATCSMLGVDIDRVLVSSMPFVKKGWHILWVDIDSRQVTFELSNSVTVRAPLLRWPALATADAQTLHRWVRTPDGQGAFWPDLDVHIYPRTLLD